VPRVTTQAANDGDAQTLPALSFGSRTEAKVEEARSSELGVPLKVKARFMFRGREPLVLIESGGQTLQLRTGSRFTIGNNVQLRVLEINSAEVRLELEASKRSVVIH